MGRLHPPPKSTEPGPIYPASEPISQIVGAWGSQDRLQAQDPLDVQVAGMGPSRRAGCRHTAVGDTMALPYGVMRSIDPPKACCCTARQVQAVHCPHGEQAQAGGPLLDAGHLRHRPSDPLLLGHFRPGQSIPPSSAGESAAPCTASGMALRTAPGGTALGLGGRRLASTRPPRGSIRGSWRCGWMCGSAVGRSAAAADAAGCHVGQCQEGVAE